MQQLQSDLSVPELSSVELLEREEANSHADSTVRTSFSVLPSPLLSGSHMLNWLLGGPRRLSGTSNCFTSFVHDEQICDPALFNQRQKPFMASKKPLDSRRGG